MDFTLSPHPAAAGADYSEEKQIEEMAKIFCGMKNGCDGCMWDKAHCNERNYAEEIYNAGYRKQSENVIELPCKVGDTVWHIRRTPEHRGGSYIVEAKIICIPIRVYPNEVYFELILRYTQRNGMPEETSSILGKYAFPTKEEAEQALAKMKGGE